MRKYFVLRFPFLILFPCIVLFSNFLVFFLYKYEVGLPIEIISFVELFDGFVPKMTHYKHQLFEAGKHSFVPYMMTIVVINVISGPGVTVVYTLTMSIFGSYRLSEIEKFKTAYSKPEIPGWIYPGAIAFILAGIFYSIKEPAWGTPEASRLMRQEAWIVKDAFAPMCIIACGYYVVARRLADRAWRNGC